jgi:selenocysteine lyase/cysteine desulfurase
MSFKRHFSRALSADPQRVHFAAHSHHLWPDVSRDAQIEAWDDAARLADRKWDKVFGEIVPSAQSHIARILGLSDPRTIAFAPNTHDFVRRVLSCLRDRPRVLTTTSEFHSFSRQTARLEEDGSIEIVRVPSEPLDSLADRLAERARKGNWDLVFVSHVLFDSGFILDVEKVVSAVKDEHTFIVVDGYHGFCAVPTDLSAIERRVFYMAGGYKYAASGEGCCFLHCPPGYGERPRDTGWFASFGTLAQDQTGVSYAEGGARFYGATFDPTGIYRLRAVLDLFAREDITVERIRAHVRPLQSLFLEKVALGQPMVEGERRGQFLTFRTTQARSIQKKLEAANVITDARGDRLRVGFGLYHDEEDVVEGAARITAALRS